MWSNPSSILLQFMLAPRCYGSNAHIFIFGRLRSIERITGIFVRNINEPISISRCSYQWYGWGIFASSCWL
uniref:Putative secreted peptide n=1 Tax=Anopheles braziliensis TaxID=58242 RepID=A0A2M3ZT51_9DIPT